MVTGAASSNVGSAQPSGFNTEAGSAMASTFSPTFSGALVENSRSVSVTAVATPLTINSAELKRVVVSTPVTVADALSDPAPNAGARITPRGHASGADRGVIWRSNTTLTVSGSEGLTFFSGSGCSSSIGGGGGGGGGGGVGLKVTSTMLCLKTSRTARYDCVMPLARTVKSTIGSLPFSTRSGITNTPSASVTSSLRRAAM